MPTEFWITSDQRRANCVPDSSLQDTDNDLQQHRQLLLPNQCLPWAGPPHSTVGYESEGEWKEKLLKESLKWVIVSACWKTFSQNRNISDTLILHTLHTTISRKVCLTLSFDKLFTFPPGCGFATGVDCYTVLPSTIGAQRVLTLATTIWHTERGNLRAYKWGQQEDLDSSRVDFQSIHNSSILV